MDKDTLECFKIIKELLGFIDDKINFSYIYDRRQDLEKIIKDNEIDVGI